MIRCADDFGMNANINEAVLRLVENKRLNAVSVMVKKLDSIAAHKLAQQKNQIKIGLHLDLFSDVTVLVSRRRVRNEIRHQINLFFLQFGFYPEFYDGHMHCHIYPVIRTELLAAVLEHSEHNPFVRSLTLKPTLAKTTRLISFLYLKLLGVMNGAFVRLLIERQIRTNQYVYGTFHAHREFLSVYQMALTHADEQNSLLFCHPGMINEKEALLRKLEYELLSEI